MLHCQGTGIVFSTFFSLTGQVEMLYECDQRSYILNGITYSLISIPQTHVIYITCLLFLYDVPNLAFNLGLIDYVCLSLHIVTVPFE